MAKNNRNNKTYSKEQKDALIVRMLPPQSCSVSNLLRETGISDSTL